MSKKVKYYVVWEGRTKGIFTNWDECKKSVEAHIGAKYKSFESLEEAEKAFQSPANKFIQYAKKPSSSTSLSHKPSGQGVVWDSISVDAACSGNPGDLEYRGVWTKTGEQIFHQGPFKEGTNNIGEFLALVHILALLKKENRPNLTIYTDSVTALSWVRNKKIKTTLEQTQRNKPLFELMDRAMAWLNANTFSNPILKWDTEKWGEIPADFGRK